MKTSGFTLIEMVVTVLIVSILAAGALPIIQLTVQRNKETELKQSLRQIREAIDQYKKAVDAGMIKKIVGQSGYPPSLEVLEQGVRDQKDVKGRMIRFIRQIPRDPMNNDVNLSASGTWAKRCYDSDVDDPVEGVDVYDVHSSSQKKSINGTLYSSW